MDLWYLHQSHSSLGSHPEEASDNAVHEMTCNSTELSSAKSLSYLLGLDCLPVSRRADSAELSSVQFHWPDATIRNSIPQMNIIYGPDIFTPFFIH
eukprot:4711725-Amphidinium_carterae.2